MNHSRAGVAGSIRSTTPGKKTARAALAAALLGAALAAGCSSSSADPSSPLPPGHYANPRTPHGSETLDITDNGSYTQTVGGYVHINGTVRPVAGGVTFVENGGGLCAGQPGTYSVTTAADGTHLAMVADPCSARALDFPSGPWSRQ